MADQKYAGLPGIVYDQPDVYETSDLPESEQEFHDCESGESNPAFEVLHISGLEAHDKFKGKTVSSANVDFSDRISKTNRTGYLTNRPIEWSVGYGEDETVVEKYQRLLCEVNHLQQEMQQLQGSIKHSGGSVSVPELGKNVDELQSMLSKLNLEKNIGKDMLSAITEPEAALQKKLVALLENFKKTGLVSQKAAAEKTPVKSDTGSVTAGLSYELYCAPEHAKFNQMARVSQLEKKLDQLEALVGNYPEKMSSLSTWTNHKSLLGCAQVLSARLALLEPEHLDHVEGRLHSIHSRMNSISEKKAAVEEADKQSKVNELYDMMKKCEVLCSALPEVVDRLTCVEGLHQEAAMFSSSLKQLDAVQANLNLGLETNATRLSAVQEQFIKNLNTIQSNMKGLEERIQKLPKK